MNKELSLTPAQLAAFRMRCWYEMGDSCHPHFADAYHQLVEDADTMCEQILLQLNKKRPSVGHRREEAVNAEAELLITALVGEFFCRPYGSQRFAALLSQAYALIHRVTNQQLLCYMLVLLFYYEERPAKGMKSQIDGMMKWMTATDMTPEDQHIHQLYQTKLHTHFSRKS